MKKNKATSILNFFMGPLLLEETACRGYLATLNERAASIDVSARSVPKSQGAAAGGIAVISVNGVLSYRPDPFLSWIFGDTGILDVQEQFRAALADPRVETIIFDLASPGGEVAGIFDFADEIYAARSQKTIIAVANELAHSAAYVIASSAEKVYLSRTASVGSNGVLAVHVDESQKDAAEGLTYTMIYAGERKADQSPHAPLSEEARLRMQSEVDSLYDILVSTVARNRGISEGDVKKQQAATYRGKSAVKAGLADGVLSWNQVLAKVSGIKSKGGTGMKTATDQIKAILAERTDLKEAEVFAAMGYTPKPADGMVLIQGTELETLRGAEKKSAQDIRASVIELCDLCALSKTPHLLKGFIEQGTTVEAAREAILQAQKDRAAGNIQSSVGPVSLGGENPLISDAKSRAGVK